MPENNSEQKEKPLAGISLRMACGSKMALFLFAVILTFLKLPLQMFISEFHSCSIVYFFIHFLCHWQGGVISNFLFFPNIKHILWRKERQKEVAELEQTISGSKEELSNILHQQIAARQQTEQIRKEGEAIRQEVSELFVTNLLLREQTEELTEDKEKLLSENEKLEKQQKKLQQEINKMVQSKEVMERNIHAYDEAVKWQLAEPGALMSAKNYRDKKALPLVEKWKEVVKNLTIKCVQLAEQSKKLTVKVDGQQKQISRLTDKVMEQSDTIDRVPYF